MRLNNSQCTAQRPCASSRRPVVVCKAGIAPKDVIERASKALQVGAIATASGLLAAQCAYAEFRLPPISNEAGRCERGYVGNTIGQANAVSDKILDLRQCKYNGADLSTKVLAGALLADADLSKTNLREAVLTKAYAVAANFEGADMTNAVIDRVDFSKANLKGVKLVNAVVTGATFEGANLEDTVWEDALVGGEDVKRLCQNPTLVGESRMQVGCRN